MAIIEKGQKAPEFDLTNQRGDHIKLSDYKGRYVLLSRYPPAFTSVCTDRMRDLKANYDFSADHNTEISGMGVDPQPFKEVWTGAPCSSDLNILSDFKPLGEASKAYGVWQEYSGASGRAVALIGPDGAVLWSHKYEDSIKPGIEEIREIVSRCKA